VFWVWTGEASSSSKTNPPAAGLRVWFWTEDVRGPFPGCALPKNIFLQKIKKSVAYRFPL
jgi:hypothetical protein